MSIVVKNSQLNNDTIQALNTLIDLDINATSAFRLTRIIKELSSIVEDKVKMEQRILDKWVQKDEFGNKVAVKDSEDNIIDGAVNITDFDEFTKEMRQLLDIEHKLPFDKISFDDLNLQTAKIKDLIKLDFLFY
jgi:hypothetical protein